MNWPKLCQPRCRQVTVTHEKIIEYSRPGSSKLIGLAISLLLFLALMVLYVSSGMSLLGTRRFLPSIAVLVGIIGIVIGRIALLRSRKGKNGRAKLIATAVLGVISLVIGGLQASNSIGGYGTGNGKAGAIFAILLGGICLVISGVAWSRSWQVTTSNSTI